MIKNLNRTIAEPFGIPSKTGEQDKSYNKLSDINWESVKEKIKALFSKELLFMLSMSCIWFFVFFYFVLYVFT